MLGGGGNEEDVFFGRRGGHSGVEEACQGGTPSRPWGSVGRKGVFPGDPVKEV